MKIKDDGKSIYITLKSLDDVESTINILQQILGTDVSDGDIDETTDLTMLNLLDEEKVRSLYITVSGIEEGEVKLRNILFRMTTLANGNMSMPYVYLTIEDSIIDELEIEYTLFNLTIKGSSIGRLNGSDGICTIDIIDSKVGLNSINLKYLAEGERFPEDIKQTPMLITSPTLKEIKSTNLNGVKFYMVPDKDMLDAETDINAENSKVIICNIQSQLYRTLEGSFKLVSVKIKGKPSPLPTDYKTLKELLASSLVKKSIANMKELKHNKNTPLP